MPCLFITMLCLHRSGFYPELYDIVVWLSYELLAVPPLSEQSDGDGMLLLIIIFLHP